MLERTMANSASIFPSCSCRNSHVVKFIISYRFIGFLICAGAVFAPSTPTASQRLLELELELKLSLFSCCDLLILVGRRWKLGERREMEELENLVFQVNLGIASAISFFSCLSELTIGLPAYLFLFDYCVNMICH